MATKKRKRKRGSQVPRRSREWECIHFTFMQGFYSNGQRAAQIALDNAPECHEDCTLSAMASFCLGVLAPHLTAPADVKRMALAVLPKILDAMQSVVELAPTPTTEPSPMSDADPRCNPDVCACLEPDTLDGGHYTCTEPRGHTGPHKGKNFVEGGTSQWPNSSAVEPKPDQTLN